MDHIHFKYEANDEKFSKFILKINKQECVFQIGYLCSPVHDLLDRLLEIIPGYSSEISHHENPKNPKACFQWQDEPWQYECNLALADEHLLTIKITREKEQNESLVMLETTCELQTFLKVIIAAIDQLIKEHGLIGYWVRNDVHGFVDLPIAKFLLLKYYLLYGKAYPIKWDKSSDKNSLAGDIALLIAQM